MHFLINTLWVPCLQIQLVHSFNAKLHNKLSYTLLYNFDPCVQSQRPHVQREVHEASPFEELSEHTKCHLMQFSSVIDSSF